MIGISSNNKVYSDIHEIPELKNHSKSCLCFKDTDVKYMANPANEMNLNSASINQRHLYFLILSEPLLEWHMPVVSKGHENLDATKSSCSSNHLFLLCLLPLLFSKNGAHSKGNNF